MRIAFVTAVACLSTVPILSSAAEDAPGESRGAAPKPGRLEEIVVTATKRSENIADVPMSISALDADLIEKRGFVGMDDYLRVMPGVNFVERGAGWNTIVMRGVSTDLVSDAAVGVYFGETPVTGLGFAGNAASDSADLKLVDVDRVEVLRGPQGTLYGAGSLAGTVRIVPAAPQLDRFLGGTSASYSQTSGTGGDNYSVQGHVNLPLVDEKLAVRVVGYHFKNSGYIDQVSDLSNAPASVVRAVNQYGGVLSTHKGAAGDEYTGMRAAALWSVTDNLDITLSHTHQVIEQFGRPDVNPQLRGEFVQARIKTTLHGGDELRKHTINITNLVAQYTTPFGTLTGSHSFSKTKGILDRDTTESFAGQPSFGYYHDEGEVSTSELRFTSEEFGRWQFFVGGYYEDFSRDWDVNFGWTGDPARDPNLSNSYGSLATHIFVRQPSKQAAAFGEVTFKLTEKLAATVGARHFRYNQNGRYGEGSGALNGGDTLTRTDTEGTGEIYKASLKYEINDDSMVYGLFSQGFRLGKPQGNVPGGVCDTNGDGVLDGLGVRAPDKIDPDKLDNYELGMKSAFFDRRMTVNASAYFIDWQGIPVSMTDPVCFFPVVFNAGKTEAKGIEVETTAALTDRITFNISASYGTSELAETAANLGNKGDDLPFSADLTYGLGVQYDFDVLGHEAFARADYAYVGPFRGGIPRNSPEAGDYGQLGAVLGMKIGGARIEIFGKNLTNSDGYTYWAPSIREAYQLRPRTIGLTMGYDF
jgi:outer membrane receptor protein involved in Fe transport